MDPEPTLAELRIRLDESLQESNFSRTADLLSGRFAPIWLASGVSPEALLEAGHLAEVGRRLVELDGEDFFEASGWAGVPPEVRAVLRKASLPASRRAPAQGQLSSLSTAVALKLELLADRYAHRRFSEVLAAVHLIGEYMPLLAWQPILGNAGDPATLARRLGAIHKDHLVQGKCSGGKSPLRVRSLARKASGEAASQPAGEASEYAGAWRDYVENQRSLVSDLLEACALSETPTGGEPRRLCHRPCSVALPDGARGDLAERMASIVLFKRSWSMHQRHSSPVGHAYSVPSRSEIDVAWHATRQRLARRQHFATWLARGQASSSAWTSPGEDAFPGLPVLIAYWGDLAQMPRRTAVLPQVRDALLDRVKATRAA